MLHCEYLFGYVKSEFFDLFAYVFHEGVARPSANHHDGKDWYPSKVHRHRPSLIQIG